MTPQDERLTLELDRIVPASRARVFSAFTSADELAQWWGPEGFTIPSIDFEPRVGGSYRIEMRPPEGEPFFLKGEFRVVEPPERLAFTFAWEDPDPDDRDTLVELTLRDLEDSTEVALRQSTFRTAARRDLHHDGWTETLDKLAQRLTR